MRTARWLMLALVAVGSGALHAQQAQVMPDAPAAADAARIAELSEKARTIVECLLRQ